MSLFSRIKNALIGRGSTVTVPLISADDIGYDERIADLETELEAAQAALKVESDENDRLAKELLEAERAVVYLNDLRDNIGIGHEELVTNQIVRRYAQRSKPNSASK